MFVKIKVSCPCHCTYTVNKDINSDKIICPNCGLEYPYSDKALSILKTAKEIPDNTSFEECCIKAISEFEDMKNCQE